MTTLKFSLNGALLKARESGAIRYVGRVCQKHPECKGSRYTANSACVGCARARSAKCASTPKAKERIRQRAKSEDVKKWRREYRRRPHVKEQERTYRQSEKERARVFQKNNAPERKEYMAQYRNIPEQRAQRALRKRMIEQHISQNATPPWANLFFIGEIYDLARLRTKHTGMAWQVDHTVPLVHPRVCGLHVETNLRVIPATVNRAKSNRLIDSLIG